MKEIFFKAGRRNSRACESYREIIKRGDIDCDMAGDADDVITLIPQPGTRIVIDCDKKTGEFRLAFDITDQ